MTSRSQPIAPPESGDPETIALLVRAYDFLEELAPDPELEDPDEDLDSWLAEADATLQRLTGRSARQHVDDLLVAQRNQWRTRQ